MSSRTHIREDLVVFRPLSSDASKDFFIPRDIAENLHINNIIYRDVTNGGFCPNPNSNYNVNQHRVTKFIL